MNKLTSAKIEEIREALCDNPELCRCFRSIDDNLNELLPITPKDARHKLYEIEAAINEIMSLSGDAAYRKGVSDTLKSEGSRKAKYMCLELESRSKNAYRTYSGQKTGWIYRICRIVKEYCEEEEADRDMARLRAGEITEGDLKGKRIHRKIGENCYEKAI